MKKKDIKSAKKKERKIKKIEADGLQNLFHQKIREKILSVF